MVKLGGIQDRKVLRIKTRPFFKWFDLWIGVYISVASQEVYVCFLTLGIRFSWWIETNNDRSFNDGWKQAVDYMRELMKVRGDFDSVIKETQSLIEH